MNGRARLLGLRCSRFVSPHGVEDGNRSCAADLAAMARLDMANRRIARIARVAYTQIRAPVKSKRLYLATTNPLLAAGYRGTVGLKTGFTEAAGRCLVAIVRRGRRTLGVVLLGSPNPGKQARTLFEHAFRKDFIVVKGRLACAVLGLAVVLGGCGDGKREGESSRDQSYKPAPLDKGKPDKGDFVLDMKKPKGDDADAAFLLKDQEPQILVDGLNETFRLPRDIRIILETGASDDDTSPYYDPNGRKRPRAVRVLLRDGGRVPRARGQGAGGPRRGRLGARVRGLPRVGHALVDRLQDPDHGPRGGRRRRPGHRDPHPGRGRGADTVLTAADWFAGLSELGSDTIGAEEFADVHSLDDQRFYSLLCWVYGSDPDTYAFLVKDGDLPKGRALGCPDEYIRNVESWIELLDPWLKE